MRRCIDDEKNVKADRRTCVLEVVIKTLLEITEKVQCISTQKLLGLQTLK